MYDVVTVTSRNELDCGATCLKMLLSYYGVDVPIDQLRVQCNTSITGCTGTDIKRAGEIHGLDMKAYKYDADNIIKCDRPCIIHWKYNHFCVFCGLDESGKIVLIDPDRGRFRIGRGIFKMFYSSVAIFNGEPLENVDTPTIEERLYDTELTADMAYVNSEILLAMIDLEE